MKRYLLAREEWIGRPINEVFAFFADARNLGAITPDWMRFQILSGDAIAMHEGAQIVYRLRWHGIPMKWTTVIDRWEPPHRFIDVQQKGPYALWRHSHYFRAVDGGTLMRDQVRYVLPVRCAGDAVHRLIVKPDLDVIFDHRARTLRRLLAANDGADHEGASVSHGGNREAGVGVAEHAGGQRRNAFHALPGADSPARNGSR